MAFGIFNKKQGATPQAPPIFQKNAPFVAAPAHKVETDPLKALSQQMRYAVILNQRERWMNHAGGPKICQAAADYMESSMAFVPEGRVTISKYLVESMDAEDLQMDVDPFLLAVHTVTNAEYQRFLDDAGYEDLSLWHEAVWPHLVYMKDQTDHPGPRYFREGRHNKNLSDHPVVGVSWFEAAAYAQWAGLRLPTEAEWQMATTWRIKSDVDIFRLFPWGDALDQTRCNIWNAGYGSTLPVHAFENGAAPNGVKQLIGNVWEWVGEELEIITEENWPVAGEMAIMGTRGGAFDTYFETQATGLFRTGHVALTRTHNVGFRCAISLDDASWFNVESD